MEIGCGTGEGSGSGTRGSEVGVCVRRQCPFALVQCSGAVRLDVGRCAVFERRELEQDPQQASPVLPSDQACLWVSTGSPFLCGAGVLCHTSPNAHALPVSSSSTLHLW